MRYDVEIGGRVRQVSVHRTDGNFVVDVEGRQWTVDAARVDAQTLSLLVGGASHDVTIVPQPSSGELAVTVGGTALSAALNRRRQTVTDGDASPGSGGPQRIVAPMPGKVVRVMVKPGEAVHKRQPVLVVEAMKMENELRASHEGVVAELHVKEGQSVEAGALLLLVEPA